MTDQHPITPPPELVQQWWDGTHGAFYEFEAVATQAARWGADQELEACCEWANATGWEGAGDSLRAARRPKPPSLKEQALERCNDYIDPDGIIRRALEALPND
jgi:hypothetical protein